MKTFKKAIALVLCLMMVFSMASIAASAATVSASLGYNEAENSGDWAYWSGSKMMKSSSTTDTLTMSIPHSAYTSPIR